MGTSALRSGPVRFFHPFGREPGPDRFYIFHDGTKNWTGPYRTGPPWLRAVTGPVLTSPELTSVLTSQDQLSTYYLLVYNYYSKTKTKRIKRKRKRQHDPPRKQQLTRPDPVLPSSSLLAPVTHPMSSCSLGWGRCGIAVVLQFPPRKQGLTVVVWVYRCHFVSFVSCGCCDMVGGCLPGLCSPHHPRSSVPCSHSSHCPHHLHSTCDPPCEQLLTRLVVGALLSLSLSVVHHSHSLHCRC